LISFIFNYKMDLFCLPFPIAVNFYWKIVKKWKRKVGFFIIRRYSEGFVRKYYYGHMGQICIKTWYIYFSAILRQIERNSTETKLNQTFNSPPFLKTDHCASFSRVFQSQLPENGAPLLPPRALTSQSLPELFHDHVIEQV